MLLIRPQQLEIFELSGIDRYRQREVARLRKTVRTDTTDEELFRLVDQAMKTGQDHGIRSEKQVRRLMNLLLEFGLDFCNAGEAANILRQPAHGWQKLDRLEAWAAAKRR